MHNYHVSSPILSWMYCIRKILRALKLKSILGSPLSRDRGSLGSRERRGMIVGPGPLKLVNRLRVLRATENTIIASYRGTCVEMYAYCSSVTVSYVCHLTPKHSQLISAYAIEGVGKSTIVTSLIKESFVSQVSQMCEYIRQPSYWLIQVQHIVPEVTIPPEVTPENVTTYIVDSGCTSR